MTDINTVKNIAFHLKHTPRRRMRELLHNVVDGMLENACAPAGDYSAEALATLMLDYLGENDTRQLLIAASHKPRRRLPEIASCCLCGGPLYERGAQWKGGNNPQPLARNGRCCDHCSQTKVLPARVAGISL